MPHSHGGHEGHGHGCEHEATDVDNALEMGIQYSLFAKIDMANLECLNEEIDGAGRSVFKPYEERLNFEKVGICLVIVFFSSNKLYLFYSLSTAIAMLSCCSIFRSPVT